MADAPITAGPKAPQDRKRRAPRAARTRGPVAGETAETLDPHEAAMSPEAVAFRREQVKEWTTYVAVQDIPYGNVIAYPTGAPVPVANVKRWLYDQQGFVAKRDTKAGQDALAALAATTTPVSAADVRAPGDA